MPSRFARVVNVCDSLLKAIESGSTEKLAQNVVNEDNKYDRNPTPTKVANRLKICARGVLNTLLLPLNLVANVTRVIYDAVEYFSQENPGLRDSKNIKNSLAALALTPLTPLFGLVCIAQPLVSLPQIAIERATGQADIFRNNARPAGLRPMPDDFVGREGALEMAAGQAQQALLGGQEQGVQPMQPIRPGGGPRVDINQAQQGLGQPQPQADVAAPQPDEPLPAGQARHLRVAIFGLEHVLNSDSAQRHPNTATSPTDSQSLAGNPPEIGPAH